MHNLKRAALAALLSLLVLVGLAIPSQAAGVSPAFSWGCHITSVTDGRTDTPEITHTLTKVDSDSFRFRTIRRADGTQSSVKFERIGVQLLDRGSWVKWTERGGTSTDNVLVGPDITWDPGAKYNPDANYTAFRYFYVHEDGTAAHTCYTNQVNF